MRCAKFLKEGLKWMQAPRCRIERLCQSVSGSVPAHFAYDCRPGCREAKNRVNIHALGESDGSCSGSCGWDRVGPSISCGEKTTTCDPANLYANLWFPERCRECQRAIGCTALQEAREAIYHTTVSTTTRHSKVAEFCRFVIKGDTVGMLAPGSLAIVRVLFCTLASRALVTTQTILAHN